MPVLWKSPGFESLLSTVKNKKAAIVTDFDRTLTHATCVECHMLFARSEAANHNGFKEAIHPVIDCASLPTEARDDRYKLEQWWIEYHRHITEKEIKDSHMRSAVVSHGEKLFRPGVADFYEACYSKDVPFVVVSAGISNLVHHAFDTEISHLPVPHIIANKVDVDSEVHPISNPITTNTKQTALTHADEELIALLKDFPVSIVLGDKPNDALVAVQHPLERCDQSEHTTVKIGLRNPTSKFPMEDYQDVFDIVLDGSHDEAFMYIKSILPFIAESE